MTEEKTKHTFPWRGVLGALIGSAVATYVISKSGMMDWPRAAVFPGFSFLLVVVVTYAGWKKKNA